MFYPVSLNAVASLTLFWARHRYVSGYGNMLGVFTAELDRFQLRKRAKLKEVQGQTKAYQALTVSPIDGRRI